MLDSTVVCRRALGCEWGGAKTGRGKHDTALLTYYTALGDQGKPGEPGRRNIGRGK